MRIKEKLVSNAIYLLLNWLVLNLLSLFYWIFAAKLLFPEEYGIVATSLGLANFLSGVSIFGLNTAIQKLIPEYLAKGKKREIAQLIKTSLKLVLTLNLSLTLLLILFSCPIHQYLKISFQGIMVSVFLTIILTISSFFSSIVYGFQKMKEYFVSNLLGRLSKVLISSLLIYLGFSYFGALVGIAAGVFVSAVISLFITFECISFRSKGKVNFKRVLSSYAFPAFITFFAWILFSNSQYILLTLIKNPEATGIFALAMVLTTIITSFPRILNSALFPIISYLSAFREKRQARLIELVIRYSIFLSLPLAFLFTIFSKEVVLIISNPMYLKASSLFPLLSLASIIFGIGNIFVSSLYAIGKTSTSRNIVVLTSISLFLFAIPLVFYFSSFGMSLAYFLSTLVLFLPGYVYIKKFLKVKFPAKAAVKCFVAALISFTILFFVTKFTPRLLDYLLALLTCFLYILLLALFSFFSKEDLEILEIFGRKIKIPRKLLEFAEKIIQTK